MATEESAGMPDKKGSWRRGAASRLPLSFSAQPRGESCSSAAAAPHDAPQRRPTPAASLWSPLAVD
ncbi:hypothetical protein E2C01_066868 [Portunus trituberculatus]|uniref:Uncharacterized protein n=1 Tax=Portunus trituberculatus TaxID=210409 RepID=A0A5B7HRW6_PORTR|nr:hypothetical protein [Portunus trituberculatus]